MFSYFGFMFCRKTTEYLALLSKYYPKLYTFGYHAKEHQHTKQKSTL